LTLFETFTAHTDPQDVFILHVAGYKLWRLYETPIALPFEEQQVGKTEDNPIDIDNLKLIKEVTLRPGDVLYIPRGMAHWANTANEASLHLTLTFPTSDWSWGVLLTNAVNHVIRHETSLRSAAPLSLLHLDQDTDGEWLKGVEKEFDAKVILSQP